MPYITTESELDDSDYDFNSSTEPTTDFDTDLDPHITPDADPDYDSITDLDSNSDSDSDTEFDSDVDGSIDTAATDEMDVSDLNDTKYSDDEETNSTNFKNDLNSDGRDSLAWLAHVRMGHSTLETMRRFYKVTGSKTIPITSADAVRIKNCTTCVDSRVTRRFNSTDSFDRSSKLHGSGKIAADIFGYINADDNDEKLYLLTIVDMETSFVEMKMITSKGLATAKIMQYIRSRDKLAANSQTIKPVTQLLTDNGAKFTSKVLNKFCATHGVEHIYTAPETHHQNGKLERFHRTPREGIARLLVQSWLA